MSSTDFSKEQLQSEYEVLPETTEEADRGPYKELFTGRRFYPLDPRVQDIDIRDIAHSLAMNCRYGGHCTRFYSVAEHSVLIARHARCMGMSPRQQLNALLHDAVEAYLGGDIPRPIKLCFPQIKEVERKIEAVVMAAFDLPAEKPDWIDELDKRIVVDERAEVMPDTGNTWFHDRYFPLGVKITGWYPAAAEEEFLEEYNVIMKEIAR